ncbi:LysR family transcriptional regulator [Pseudacidovorax sp. NFM-22]|uniref:LysR family transcriptional regulator n=1 Tax=Pseudacidovorax sp. NFM-22 TaxID=2744469 RepID=UPI001F42622A|nr:LysR substrate-binding domain-containing protein [Pseudacidovorax sp. NFM-22]
MNILASLRYLAALAEHRHFGRAAAACHITQPALSNAMRALEAEFGVAIVRRGRAYAGLTPEGEQVLATAHRMLHEHERLQQQLRSEAGQPRGRLRMAAVPTAIPLLSRFAARLRARHPGIVPTVLSMSSLELETGLDHLAIDLALGYTGRQGPAAKALQTWPQIEEHYFLLRRPAEAPAATMLARGQPIGWAEAAALPLCLLTPEMHNRAIVDAAFAEAGATGVAPAVETNSVLTLVLAVQAGDVCAVLPGAMVDTVRGQPGLVAQPLVGPTVRTPLGFMAPAAVRPSRALEAALGLLQSQEWLSELRAHGGALEA